jgi:hypothetical protein
MNLRPIVLPDTNYLIEYPRIDKEGWLLQPLEIIISETVMAELRGLTRHDYGPLKKQVQLALKHLTQLQERAGRNRVLQLGKEIRLHFEPRFTDVRPPLEAGKPDHQLIAYALSRLKAKPPQFCAILSDDKELCDIAEALGAIAVQSGNKLHEELVRKHHWWQQIEKPQEEPVRPQSSKSGSEQRFESFIKYLYGQVIVNRFRTVLAIAPLRARIALTTTLIEQVPDPEGRSVLLVVESEKDVAYWTAQIRLASGITPEEVQIFGHEYLEKLDEPRVIVYRHDQVSRRLPKHLDRLQQAKHKLTAIVDACDMLDAVSLAHLLFECDQFIGLTHHALGYAQPPVSQMLTTFLRGKSQAAYAFADAERDGWGHAFDLYPRRVDLTPEVHGEWIKINSDYLKQREQVLQQHPELQEAEDFWQALFTVMHRKAAPEAGRLLELREAREQLAQVAPNKSAAVIQLIRTAGERRPRRLIFDYERQWTPVLLNTLRDEGLAVTELPTAGELQRQVWSDFSGKKSDTLLLSEVPPFDFPVAAFSQLIILTPLRPITGISTMVDWALTHMQGDETLCIDLLYVDDTPEKVAMLELAEACFDLRYARPSVKSH